MIAVALKLSSVTPRLASATGEWATLAPDAAIASKSPLKG